MEIGLGIDGSLGLSLAELGAVGVAGQQRGYSTLWTTAGSVPDPLFVCAEWARATRAQTGASVRTGIAVLPALRTFEPLTLAAQAVTLGALSGGAFVLGVGSGGGAQGAHFARLGFAGRPIEATRAYVKALRIALSGEELGAEVDGLPVAPGRLRGVLFPVPIYVAALGPRMLRVAGELADGASLSWATPAHIAWSRARLLEGVATAGRSPSEVVLSGYVRVCIDDDVVRARRALLGEFLRYGLRSLDGSPLGVYRAHYTRMGFEEALVETERRRDSGASADELADAFPEELASLVGYYGDGRDLVRRYRELSVGLDETVVRVVASVPGTAPVDRVLAALDPLAIAGGSATVAGELGEAAR